MSNSQLDTLQTIVDDLVPGVKSEIPVSSPTGISPLANSCSQDTAFDIFSIPRMDRAVSFFEPFKSAGPDNIRPAHLLKGWESLKHNIQYIFIISFLAGRIPAAWSHSKGVIIPKPGKDSYSKSYRITNLSPVILKLMERLILWYIQFDINFESKLSNNQFGFRRGFSTEAAIHKLVSRIESSLSHGSFALGIFLDIEGAFDNMSFDAINSALSSSSIPSPICNWISEMLSTRIVSYSLGEEIITRHVTKGCPQGGILSPFIWNLVLNDLLVSVNSSSDLVQAFADDLVIINQGIDASTVRDSSQSCLNFISEWCDSVGLSLSQIKTKVIMFTWNRKWNLVPLVGE